MYTVRSNITYPWFLSKGCFPVMRFFFTYVYVWSVQNTETRSLTGMCMDASNKTNHANPQVISFDNDKDI